MGLLPGPPARRLRLPRARLSHDDDRPRRRRRRCPRRRPRAHAVPDPHRRPARPPPCGHAALAVAVLRGPDRAEPRRGPVRVGRRGHPLPRLLRRHPHDDDRARPARGDGGRAGAGRQDPALLHAVPQRADRGAGRADRGAVRHPRRQGVPHALRHRGQRRGAAHGHGLPAQQPGLRDAQQLPRALVLHDRHHQPPLVEPDVVLGAADHVRAGRLPVAQPVPRPAGRRVHRRLRRRPAPAARHGHLR